MLERLKVKLGIKNNNDDELLLLYLEDAINYVLNYCHIAEVPKKLESTVIDIAVVFYNKSGVEGQLSHSEGGISRGYTDGLPKSIVSILKTERRLQ